MNSSGELRVQNRQISYYIMKHLVHLGHGVNIKSATSRVAQGHIPIFIEPFGYTKIKTHLFCKKQFVPILNLARYDVVYTVFSISYLSTCLVDLYFSYINIYIHKYIYDQTFRNVLR